MPNRKPDIDEAEMRALSEGASFDDDHEDSLEGTEDPSAATKSARQLDAEYSLTYHIPKKLKRRYELIDSDVLLSVRYLKQFFFFGSKIHNQKLKAVGNVSFDVHKGECFGIVGESGCGKTTTGRTIIKLYNPTSGSIYYRGYRIGAGSRWNKKEIKWVRIKGKKKIAELTAKTQEELAAMPEEPASVEAKLNDIRANLAKTLADLDASYGEKIAQTPAPTPEETAAFEEKFNARLREEDDAYAKGREEILGSKADLKVHYDADVAALKQDRAKALEGIADKEEIAKIKTKFAEQLGERKTKFKTETSNIVYVFADLRAGHIEKVDAIREERKTALRAFDKRVVLKDELEAKKAEATDKANAELCEASPRFRVQFECDRECAKIREDIRETVAVQRKKIREIKYDNVHTPKRLLNEIQMIFQDPVDSLDPRMTVEDIIQEGLRIQGHHNRAENHKKVVEMLEKVGLVAEHASRYPHEFSGGQRQRIGIARALVMNPKLLICDEPISALDVSIRAQVINLLNDLKDEFGLTIIFIAHDLSVVKYFCNRIAVMYFGKMVELASSDELFRHPLHPYTVSLLSAIPKPNPLTEKERTRILYNPATAHDYSVDKPELREVCPGHVVYCNQAEFEQYQQKIRELDAANGK